MGRGVERVGAMRAAPFKLSPCLVCSMSPLQMCVVHLSKTNPTLLAGEPLPLGEAVSLEHGDVISIAGRHFRFEYSESFRKSGASSTQASKKVSSGCKGGKGRGVHALRLQEGST